jgi:hypothetical protein
MFDDPAAYYQENVVASFFAYQKINNEKSAGKSRDLNYGLTAATSLFHFREFLPERHTLSRRDAECLCPDYGLLGDIVNVAKHRSIEKETPHGEPLIKKAEDLSERIVFIRYEDDKGPYQAIQKVIVVKLNDGTERYLLEILTNVINFWEEYLYSIGVLKATHPFLFQNPLRARTRAEVGENRFLLEYIEGVRFQQSFQVFHYNNKTGKAELVDQTGIEERIRQYRSQCSVVITLTDKNAGKKYMKTIFLSEAEKLKLSSLSTAEEQQGYLEGLPSVQAASRKLIIETEPLLVKDKEITRTQ